MVIQTDDTIYITHIEDLNFKDVLKQENITDYLNITSLYITYNNFDNLDGISKFKNLEYLICYNNKIKTLKHLNKLENLSILNCMYNNLDNFEGLENCKYLKKLNSDYNNIKNLDNLKNCINIEHLSLENCKLKTLKGIEKLINLNSLYCKNNLLSKDPYIAYKYVLNLKHIHYINSYTFNNIRDNCFLLNNITITQFKKELKIKNRINFIENFLKDY